MSSSQPVRFDKYLLLDKIAVGGMAEVFRAKLIGEKGFEKPVVLKKMLPHLHDEEEMVNHFIDEAKLASHLKHENIIHIYDFGNAGNTFFIAMEYLFGKDLHIINTQAREKGRRIDLANILFIISKICEGLAYAHELTDLQGNPLNIIHRDISPHNIFITYEGQVKLIDFGIAKAALKSTKTQTGIIKGKVAYMSPEQAAGQGIDYRSDIFAVGIILYELVTGSKMFAGDTFQVLSKVIQAEYEPPEKLNPEIPPPLLKIIYKSLEKDPEDRYQSCEEMGRDIDDCIYELKYRPNSKKLSELVQSLFKGHYEIEKQQMAQAMQQNAALNTVSGGKPGIQGGHQPTEAIDTGFKTSANYTQHTATEIAAPASYSQTEVLVSNAGSTKESIQNKWLVLSTTAKSYISKVKSFRIQSKRQAVVLGVCVVLVLILAGITIGYLSKTYDENGIKIDYLLQAGNKSLDDKRIISPEKDCALYYFQQILKIDSGNDKAKQGLEKVVSECIRIAQSQMHKLNIDAARQYVKIGLEIDPENEELLKLKTKTASGTKMILENVKSIFK